MDKEEVKPCWGLSIGDKIEWEKINSKSIMSIVKDCEYGIVRRIGHRGTVYIEWHDKEDKIKAVYGHNELFGDVLKKVGP